MFSLQKLFRHVSNCFCNFRHRFWQPADRRGLDVALQRSQARSKCKFRIASGWMGHDRHEVLFLRCQTIEDQSEIPDCSPQCLVCLIIAKSQPFYSDRWRSSVVQSSFKWVPIAGGAGDAAFTCGMSENLMKQEQKLANGNWMNSFCFRFH